MTEEETEGQWATELVGEITEFPNYEKQSTQSTIPTNVINNRQAERKLKMKKVQIGMGGK